MPGAPLVIDVWMQPALEPFSRNEIFTPLHRWGSTLAVESSDITVKRLDDAGVRLGLLSAWEGPMGALVSNADVEHIVRQHPNRFRGICSVNIRQPMKAIAEVRSCAKRGFVGLRVLPWLWELPPNDRRFYPLYAECIGLDIPYCAFLHHLVDLLLLCGRVLARPHKPLFPADECVG